ncbi:MAG: hypothetical protein ACYS47_17485, partial [Planctomycetota bacterium]
MRGTTDTPRWIPGRAAARFSRAAGLLLLLLAWPGLARGEEAGDSVRRVGILAWRESAPTVMVREGLRRGLQQTRLPLRIEEEVCGGDPARAATLVARWRTAGFALYFAIDPEA